MDHISTLYDNLSSDSVFSADTQTNGLSHSESYTIIQQLASTIDLRKVTSVFFSQLKSKLSVKGLKVSFPTGSFTIGDVDPSRNQKVMEMSEQHQVFATLTYCFDDILSLRESNMLQALHRYFKFPLKNALEHQEIKQLALKDHLTSLGNRANYHETLARLISQAKRNDDGFSLLLIDMDKFKLVNDTFGHHEGDNVLMAMSDVMRTALRDTDFAFRFGGDEFCSLLPGSDNQTNQLIAQRIQHLMTLDPILSKHGITCSIGFTCYQENDTEQSLFNRADCALYSAKQSGRSCYKAA